MRGEAKRKSMVHKIFALNLTKPAISNEIIRLNLIQYLKLQLLPSSLEDELN